MVWLLLATVNHYTIGGADTFHLEINYNTFCLQLTLAT
nr:MAG TPA: hypothetical protein [Caudoviricetes sp.]